jgi:hypothetical protein
MTAEDIMKFQEEFDIPLFTFFPVTDKKPIRGIDQGKFSALIKGTLKGSQQILLVSFPSRRIHPQKLKTHFESLSWDEG